MRRRCLLPATLGLLGFATAWMARAETVNADLPSRSEVVAVMNLVAEQARRTFPASVDAYWDDGVYHIGLMALHGVTHDPALLAYTVSFGRYNGWTLDRGGTANLHNRLAAAQSWISASSTASAANLTDVRTEIAAQTSASLNRVTSDSYFAVDAQFMALPAFAMLGKRDGKPAYFSRLHELFDYNKSTLGLYDRTARLYYRDASYIYPARQTPSGRKIFWSRGNGWALAALARVLSDLPASDPWRAEYVATFRELAGAIRAVQRPDGLWNMSLYDPNHYPGPEVSGTALFAYGLAWGINNGLLSRSTYRPTVVRAWNGMVAIAVHPDGQLGYVQGIGQHPVPARQVTYESSADFGVGAFLLAGSEVFKLAADGAKFEAEKLSATVSSGDSLQTSGDAWASGGRYSRGLFGAAGDFVQYSALLPTSGTYNVKVRLARGPDLGRWKLSSAGASVGVEQDGYAASFLFTEVDLGEVVYSTSGRKLFRFAVTGKNAQSTGHGTAVDYLMLTRR
jgi:rhamnogalacturonyl hydrolase YesR